MEAIRIDKYLWAMRIFKTRSDAADACKGSKVKINGIDAKPSREVKEGEVITVRRQAVVYTYKVIALMDKRQPAKNVPLYIENLTPEEELAKLNPQNFVPFSQREQGAGRPTKKDRRELDELFEQMNSE
jgi:ribosome-associated heat shock protein Hsp15